MQISKKFCALVVGNLGLVGEKSLSTILSLKGSKICLMADTSGFNYLDSYIRTLDTKNASSFCKHSIPQDLQWVLEGNLDSGNYSKFGEKKFFRLMHLKWQIIKECILENDYESHVTFTDLDVLWKKFPINPFLESHRDNQVLAIQKDFSKSGRKFFCPGIMIWKTSLESQQILSEIQNFHAELMIRDENIPDDKALNIWISKENNANHVIGLNETQYIIGHRLLLLLLGLKGFALDNFTAFHANYALGLPEKNRNFSYASLKQGNIFGRCVALSVLILSKLRNRYLLY